MPFMGQDIHYVPAQYDVQRDTPREQYPVVERPAKVIEVDGTTVCLVAFNRTGQFFGQDIEHDPAGEEWSWHAPDECPFQASWPRSPATLADLPAYAGVRTQGAGTGAITNCPPGSIH